MYYAHSTENDKSEWQSLLDHLENTAEIAGRTAGALKLSELATIAGLLHDIGKYADKFQRRLEGETIRVDHSTAGSKAVMEMYNKNPIEKIMATMLAYCIAGHHGGLPDYGSIIDTGDDPTLCGRLKRNVEDYKAFAHEIDVTRLILPTRLPIRPITKDAGFSLSFLTRMLYSTLVDADFIETEAFYNKGKQRRSEHDNIQTLSEKLTVFLKAFEKPSGAINIKRTETLNHCIQKASEKPGLFTMTVPTGGGKTISSLAFALQHAVQHGMRRVIYVIPYTSIIEQNAMVFRNCLDPREDRGEPMKAENHTNSCSRLAASVVENVLEHHSNFDWRETRGTEDTEKRDDSTNDILGKLKMAAENWDIPVVVTTNVQFFESLFANRSSRCRKIHNIAKSVIIFDEAQMLPTGYLTPCLYAVYELIQNYGASAVFCTATQPSLDKFLPKEAELKELTEKPEELYNFYKRVEVNYSGKVSDEEILHQLNMHNQVLCIVNTRRHAKGLFDSIDQEGRYHLSTLMCPAHRKKTIAEIKERILQKQTCRVISTQIMEAGIDIDFPVGYRALAGLDSIIQAAGRVNREGKQKLGQLHVFEPDSEFVKRVPAYIRQGAEVARKVLREYTDPVSMEAIHSYYEQMYDLQDPQASDQKGIIQHFEKGIRGEPNFDFKTAAEKFRLIENVSVSIIIPYEEGVREILDRVRVSPYPRSFSRVLQPYTVNIYEREFQALEGMGAIVMYGEIFAVLDDPGLYDEETGLLISQSVSGEGIFFDG